MSLDMRIGRGDVTFAWADDNMTASWTLTKGMDEGQIMAKILNMVVFLRAQPVDADVIPMPVRAVPDTDDENVMDMRHEYEARRHDHQDETPGHMTWVPAKPVPPMSDLVARLPNGFEMIPPGDEEFDPA